MLEGPEPATLVPYIGQVCTIVWKPSLTVFYVVVYFIGPVLYSFVLAKKMAGSLF